nr:hypothetical protein [Kofleriaceae bacterium]
MRWTLIATLLCGCELVAGIPDTKQLQLEDLSFIGGSTVPAFDPSTLAYTDHMGDEDIISIDAFANDQKASVSVTANGGTVTGSGSVDATIQSIADGAMFEVNVDVSSTTGVTTAYTVTVIKP